MRKKRIAIIGSAGIPANYGGFETLVHYLTKEKSSHYDFVVFCQKTIKKDRLYEFNQSKLKYIPLKANGGQSIIYDIISILLSWFRYDTLLILGTPGCIILPFLNIIKRTRTVVNFGGLEWERQKWSKLVRWYLKISEKIAIRFATVVVADNQHFQNYIKKEYKKESVVIEYGSDHTSYFPVDSSLIEKYPYLRYNYDVSVSRAQSDNNLHVLLEAYSKMPERNLVLISNYEKFEYGKQLKKVYSKYPNIVIQDAIYDLQDLDTIRSNAKLYIHSHSFCGTAPSLVEAMHLGLPIIALDVPTNRYTTENKATYFKTVNDLKEILTHSHERLDIISGTTMKEIAERKYTWKIIANKYSELF